MFYWFLGHHESNTGSQPSTPRTGSHYDRDSGILGESELCNDSFSSGSDSGFCHHATKNCSRCSTDDGHAQDLTELLDHETKETKPRGRRQIGKTIGIFSVKDRFILYIHGNCLRKLNCILRRRCQIGIPPLRKASSFLQLGNFEKGPFRH